jgi:WD repeat-containing protein 90
MLDDTSTPKIIFAATSLGTLLQISYHTRNVLCVLKLHSGPIKTLAVNEGYAVTGSDDSYLRLWPLDFSDFLLEAQHEVSIDYCPQKHYTIFIRIF